MNLNTFLYYNLKIVYKESIESIQSSISKYKLFICLIFRNPSSRLYKWIGCSVDSKGINPIEIQIQRLWIKRFNSTGENMWVAMHPSKCWLRSVDMESQFSLDTVQSSFIRSDAMKFNVWPRLKFRRRTWRFFVCIKIKAFHHIESSSACTI